MLLTGCLFMVVAWFEWHSHSVLLRYRNVPLYLAQCNRKFQGHNQVSSFVASVWTFSFDHASFANAYTNIPLDGSQTCLCNIVIYRRDFSVSLCWHGCIGYREVEDCQSNLQACSLPLSLSLHCSSKVFFSWICMFCHVQPSKICCFELHYFSLGAGFKSCFRFPIIISIKFDQKNSKWKDIF